MIFSIFWRTAAITFQQYMHCLTPPGVLPPGSQLHVNMAGGVHHSPVGGMRLPIQVSSQPQSASQRLKQLGIHTSIAPTASPGQQQAPIGRSRHYRCIDNLCLTIWNDVLCDIMQKFTLCHNVQHHLDQSENWIFCISLVLHTFIVWQNVISRMCQSIGRQFKCSVDTLIIVGQVPSCCVNTVKSLLIR